MRVSDRDVDPIAQAHIAIVGRNETAAEGKADRPAHVTQGLPIRIEDAAGVRRVIKFVAIVDNQSLVKGERGKRNSGGPLEPVKDWIRPD